MAEREAAFSKLQDALGPLAAEEQAFCQDDCLERYLRARNWDVKKAAALLKGSLEWRRSFGVGGLSPVQFPEDVASGRLYVAGRDAQGRSVLVLRKRADRPTPGAEAAYLRYMVLVLETAARAMQQGAEQWVFIMDMAGYSRANSPRMSVTFETMRIFANQYPERLAKVFFVDAPPVFSVLYGAVKPFLDPITRAKVAFVRSSDAKPQQEAQPAQQQQQQQPTAGAIATASVTASAVGPFEAYYPFYAKPFDVEAYKQLLREVWGCEL